MSNPHYGLWGFDDIDPTGYNDDGSPYVRPTHYASGSTIHRPTEDDALAYIEREAE